MGISVLELANFRSYEQGQFELHPDVTLIVGPNGSGKTNLLESLYVLAVTKSFRAHDRDLIRHGQDFFRISTNIDGSEVALGLSSTGDSLQKKVTHGGVQKPLSTHVGRLQVTLFEPSDLALVSGPPDGRRKYLDFVLCQTDAQYLKILQQYRRVLRQRNALLEAGNSSSLRDQLFAWDVKLAELAVQIYERRQQFLKVLADIVPVKYEDIAGERIDITFDYLASVDGVYADQFLKRLNENLLRDVAAGFTTIGPHREDFKVKFAGTDISSVASRGEVRTVVLAMKMAEIAYVEEHTGAHPLLLLDDVFSELDKSRRRYLIEELRGHQAFITTTDADSISGELTTPHSVIHTEALSRA